MGTIYYVILGITASSYLVGLFLSYCEKKEKISILADMSDAGFINVYGNDYLENMELDPPMMYQKGFSEEVEKKFVMTPYMDEEIL